MTDLPHLESCDIVLNNKDLGLDQRVYNMPSASQVAAIIIESNQEKYGQKNCHIQVYNRSNSSNRIYHTYSCYDPLNDHMLFPFGQRGWHFNINPLPPTSTGTQPIGDELAVLANTTDTTCIIEAEEKGNLK